jgi:signal transduction histidine kinase
MASVRPEVTSRRAPPRAKTLRSRKPPQPRDLPNLLAHDLKSPLAAISMNLDFALSELNEPAHEPIRAALRDCKEANARAVRIVSDMAEALRLVAGNRKPFLTDVAAPKLIESVVASASAGAAARGVRIVWASSDDLVRADFDLLEGALERLVQRALRHATETCLIDQRGGTFVIRAPTSSSGTAAVDSSLSVLFAEAAVRALSGRLSIEMTAGALVYRVSVPVAERAPGVEVIR